MGGVTEMLIQLEVKLTTILPSMPIIECITLHSQVMFIACCTANSRFRHVSSLWFVALSCVSMISGKAENLVDQSCWAQLESQSMVRAGASDFRVVRPLRARKCEQGRGVWGHAPPGKLGTLRSLLRPCLGQKCY